MGIVYFCCTIITRWEFVWYAVRHCANIYRILIRKLRFWFHEKRDKNLKSYTFFFFFLIIRIAIFFYCRAQGYYNITRLILC